MVCQLSSVNRTATLFSYATLRTNIVPLRCGLDGASGEEDGWCEMLRASKWM